MAQPEPLKLNEIKTIVSIHDVHLFYYYGSPVLPLLNYVD